jgi:hypothetical protein
VLDAQAGLDRDQDGGPATSPRGEEARVIGFASKKTGDGRTGKSAGRGAVQRVASTAFRQTGRGHPRSSARADPGKKVDASACHGSAEPNGNLAAIDLRPHVQ